MKRTLALFLALATSAVLDAQVFLTSFGFDDFIDNSSPALDQTADSGHFSADSLTAILSGDFENGPVNIADSHSVLELTATVTEAPNVGFSISLVDVDMNSFRYDGVWTDFITGQSGTVTLFAAAGQSGPFDFTQVIGLDFGFDSLSDGHLDVTFTGLTANSAAVPEPSTYAVFAGAFVLAGALGARRRRV